MSQISIIAMTPTIGRNSLRRAIDSILKQSHPVSELAVVNPESPRQFPEFGARLTRDKSARDLKAKSARAYADSAFDISLTGNCVPKSRFSHRPWRQVCGSCGLSSVVPCDLGEVMLWMVGEQNHRPVVPTFVSNDQSRS